MTFILSLFFLLSVFLSLFLSFGSISLFNIGGVDMFSFSVLFTYSCSFTASFITGFVVLWGANMILLLLMVEKRPNWRSVFLLIPWWLGG